MNIAMINCGLVGSTGKIMLQIADCAVENGHNVCLVASALPVNKTVKTKHKVLFIGSELTRKINVALGRITGFTNCFAYFATKRVLKQLDSFNPDLIHLHNLHESYINLPLLFKYIKKKNIKIVWTLHDCWDFTGHCSYCDRAGCDKWKTYCYNCPNYKDYPISLIDNSKYMYRLKNKWFKGIENLTIVTPSNWLAGLVKQSFLKDYPVKVINNGIDLSVFKPTDGDFRQKYGLENKFILLGVAFGWGKKKGLDVFIELSKRFDEKFQIVLVGTDDNVDKLLPENIISVHRTHNQTELAEIYSAADLFINPTREDNYPTVNMEAIACGTPVLTFNTGGSPELVSSNTGSIVECDDIFSLKNEIIRICNDKPFSTEACIEASNSFNNKHKFKDYVELYTLFNN